ncbi:integrase family protein [Methanolacinia petrolearia DSM 11571]|uniref:Integrase family protein n=1 Tax=Methanolacinia petrolearia (strain DSM 11571 / OCM 486 / SEBR 4847) TaxID=679926 RepID=E1RD91_METP4|nr:site-specific integrase [Methanolacinia petrolearia]ADN37074.1 integrase family protein [Methanolacinia petrolearia DSM 11571]
MAKSVFHRGESVYNGNRSIQKHQDSGELSESDTELIKKYISERQATRHIGEGRSNKITFCLVGWKRFLTKPDPDNSEISIPINYKDLTISDLYRGINNLKNGTSSKGKPFKRNTIHDHIVILKGFLRWLTDEGYIDIPDKKINEISAPGTDFDTTLPEDIITKDEIIQLIKACDNSRDRALIAVHYQTAARPAETAHLRWGDITLDEYGAEVRVTDRKRAHQKGTTYRYPYITWATPYLAAWMNDYVSPEGLGLAVQGSTGKPPSNDLVFLTSRGTMIDYIRFTRIIDKAKERAGIKKRITPHLFRKSRITHMLAEGYSETTVKEIAWGNAGTGMIRTYSKLSKADIRNEILDRAGIIKKAEVAPPILPRTCYKCDTQNAPTAEYCNKCGEPLTDEAKNRQAEKVDRVFTEIDEDPRLKIINEKLAAFKQELLKEIQ